MPRPSAVGLAPAATLRRPSATMAWASTVAVVVPSPATSLVLVAAVLASWAPEVLERVVELDLARDGDTVVGDGRATELLVQHDVPPARAEGDLDRVGQLVHPALQRATAVLVEADLLRHCLPLSGYARTAAPASGRDGGDVQLVSVS